MSSSRRELPIGALDVRPRSAILWALEVLDAELHVAAAIVAVPDTEPAPTRCALQPADRVSRLSPDELLVVVVDVQIEDAQDRLDGFLHQARASEVHYADSADLERLRALLAHA